MIIRYGACASAMAMAAGLLSTPAHAQAAGPATPPAAGATDTPQETLGDIVVTAQKRAERLQNVPVSINAFSATALSDANISNAIELQRTVPSLALTTSASGVLPFLRGIGNASTTPGNEPSTALYIDGVYYPRLPNSVLTLNNVERVEVLKGPQGTLFGRNAVGGLIQIVTRDPSFDTTGTIKLGYGNYNTFTGSLYASTGLTDWLAADLAVQGVNQADGWGHNISTGADLGYENNISVRSKFLFKLGSDTRIILSGNYQKTKTTIGTPSNTYRGTIQAAPSAPNVPLFPVGFYDSRNGGGNTGNNQSYGFSARIEQGLGFADLTSLTAWQRETENNFFDFDYTIDPFFLLNNNVTEKTFSEELRLSSKAGSPIIWTVGGYYSHIYALAGPTIQSGTQFGVNQAISYVYQSTDSYAAFGQATVPLGMQTNLTGGVRYSSDHLKSTGHNDTQTPAAYIAGVTLPLKTQTYDRVNFKVSLDHHLIPTVMIYASYSTGYKAGTFNVSAATTTGPAAPESIKAVEAGIKAELFDNKVRLNVAGFHYDLANPQVQIRNGTAFVLINAGSARSQGFEVDGDAALARGLTMHFGGSYLDAKYTNFVNAPIVTQRTVTPPYGNTAFGVFDASGSMITRAPKYTANVGLDYKFETAAGKFQLSATYAYNDGFFWTVDHQIKQNPYGLVDAQIGYRLPGTDAWRFQIWGKNLSGTKYYAYGTEGAGVSGFAGAPAAPRTFGGTAEFKF